MNDALPRHGKMAEALRRLPSEHYKAPEVGSVY